MALERRCLMTNSPLTANQLEKNAPGAYCCGDRFLSPGQSPAALPTSLQRPTGALQSTRPSTRVKPSLASNHFRLSSHSSNLTSARIDLLLAPVFLQESPPHPPPFNHIANISHSPCKPSDLFTRPVPITTSFSLVSTF
ncbi:unnamed protein product [Clonostachys rosea]|uniref:Uncharacterized protein n=1 Tax=Bionectria ochroleuca TaxID=29856 RepID=A0ABY6UXM7_BIOOC|nr:unnamed protein product [Clonostachys rosea]